ncbi:MAG: PAS domain-containing protein [Rhodospirillaceae bacterium]|nr:PAS domain-containing protein [Rhodospirillaceae bacterium]
MGARIRAFDWSRTPLGPVAHWPQSLRTSVDLMLGSGHAMQIAWGPERTILYNDAYVPMLGARHPDALGLPFREAWPDIWGEIEPLVAQVFAGRTVRFEDMPLLMTRHGYPEETWWNFSYSPVRDESGAVAGLLNVTVDATPKVWAARAEAALRESEARFQQFATAASAALWIRNADTLAMEYVSPAMRDIYGVEPSAFLGDIKHWASAIVPEDRDVAMKHIERAREGEAAVHEFRIQRPSDGSFRWIRDTDFALYDEEGRVQRVGGIAEDVTEAKLAVEHQAVLLSELQHRVRNIMAIIRSITARTAERAESVPDYARLMAGRLMALTRVQALLTRKANVEVDLGTIVRDEVDAQANHDGQYELSGPDVALSPKAGEILTLAIHELATNALKYGALSAPHGKVTVRWETFEKRGVPWLRFDWTEEGAPPRAASGPRRHGFGSELIEARIPYELGGVGRLVLSPGGARCHLEFPLRDGASILETGAPQRTTVFGGALDMSGEPDLKGRKVLVVEDDYYMASDAARALQGAGAAVVGVCPTEDAALAALDREHPELVVLDINLGPGASFKLAALLKERGIPFIFVTGYDEQAIPSEFDAVPRLQKPVDLRALVRTVAAG